VPVLLVVQAGPACPADLPDIDVLSWRIAFNAETKCFHGNRLADDAFGGINF